MPFPLQAVRLLALSQESYHLYTATAQISVGNIKNHHKRGSFLRSLAIKKSPRMLWNPKFQYHAHNSRQLYMTLANKSSPYPIPFLQGTPRLSLLADSILQIYRPKLGGYFFYLPCCRMTRPSHAQVVHHNENMLSEVKILIIFIMRCTAFRNFFPLNSNINLTTMFF